MKSFGKFFDLIIVIAVVEIITRTSGYLSNVLTPYFVFIDPDKVFIWSWIHHIIQLLLALFAMLIYPKVKFKDWGFNLKNSKLSLSLFLKFSLGWFVLYTIGAFITIKMSNQTSVFPFQLTTRNVLGYSGFMFLMPGLSEETLFRGFVMVVLGQSWKRILSIGKIAVPVSGLIAALIFTYAHISYTLFPLKIYFSLGQLIFSFVLGVFYAIIFFKTKSLLGPILCHNISDGLGFVIIYLLSILCFI
ncbi:MAG TPA: type II CAAX endopeptidase family protein [Paludibacter sp.]